MKNKIITFIRRRFLQFLLSLVAYFSWVESSEIGRRVSEIAEKGDFFKNLDELDERASGGVSVAITSGFDGGAISMGLITSICIIGIVWIEIARKK